MKKVSKFTLCGVIAVLTFLLIIQGLVIHSKQKELEIAKAEYDISKEMYADLELSYNTLNEDFRSLKNTYSDLVDALKTKHIKTDSQNKEQLSTEPIVKEETENNSPAKLEHETFDKSAFANKVLTMYLNGEWDGYPTTVDFHKVSLNWAGSIKIDGETWVPTNFYCNHSIDLPADMKPVNTMQFILGDGTYQLVNNRIIKYSQGKSIPLSGGSLDWSGMDTENYRPYDTYFYYDEPHDTLFLIASSVPYDFSNLELRRNVGIFLYKIPDRSKSELEFVSEINAMRLFDTGLVYADTNDNVWVYTEKNGNCHFEQSSDAKLRDKLQNKDMIAEGEIETDWWFAFADGYIHERDAFPEGTFTHPVTTTPSVGLTEFEW